MRQKESSMSCVTAALLAELGRKKSAISYQKLVASLTNGQFQLICLHLLVMLCKRTQSCPVLSYPA